MDFSLTMIPCNGHNIESGDAEIKVDQRGFIPVNGSSAARCGTFAIGDIVGQPMLAHKASHAGMLVAVVMVGKLSDMYMPTIKWLLLLCRSEICHRCYSDLQAVGTKLMSLFWQVICAAIQAASTSNAITILGSVLHTGCT